MLWVRVIAQDQFTTKQYELSLRSNDATSQYGPGHNSFTVSEDGQSDILVYHARPYRDIVGDPFADEPVGLW